MLLISCMEYPKASLIESVAEREWQPRLELSKVRIIWVSNVLNFSPPRGPGAKRYKGKKKRMCLGFFDKAPLQGSLLQGSSIFSFVWLFQKALYSFIVIRSYYIKQNPHFLSFLVFFFQAFWLPGQGQDPDPQPHVRNLRSGRERFIGRPMDWIQKHSCLGWGRNLRTEKVFSPVPHHAIYWENRDIPHTPKMFAWCDLWQSLWYLLFLIGHDDTWWIAVGPKDLL